jgi:hypothetical protein
VSWWDYALIGVGGAAVERAIVFLRALDRVPNGDRPWRIPHGPGGGMYLLAIVLHLIIAAIAVGALAGAGLVTNSFVALGAGAGAVQLVKQARGLALRENVPSKGERTDQTPALDPPEREVSEEQKEGDDDAA